MNRRNFFKRAAGAAAIPVAAAVAATSADELIAAAKAAQEKAFNATVSEYVACSNVASVRNDYMRRRLQDAIDALGRIEIPDCPAFNAPERPTLYALRMPDIPAL